MFDIAQDMLRTIGGRPATFTGSAGSFDLSAAIVEADKRLGTSNRDHLIGSSVAITMLRDVRLRKGGTISTPDGRAYRLDKPVPSPVPGLVDWGAERIQGEAVVVTDFTRIIPRNDVVTIAGVDVPCHVNEAAEVQEVGEDGMSVVSLKTVLAVLAPAGAGLRAGALVGFRGRMYTLAQPPMADGVGFVKLII